VESKGENTAYTYSRLLLYDPKAMKLSFLHIDDIRQQSWCEHGNKNFQALTPSISQQKYKDSHELSPT
jgi:hypothetical protein